jgi:predicted nucleotidyltransferase
VYVFGSRASEVSGRVKGHAVPQAASSDVDIGVLPKRGHVLTARDRARLSAELEDLLGAPRVDLVVLPEALSFLAFEVIKGELLVDTNPDRTAEFELYVLRRTGDLLGFDSRRIESVLTERAR